MAGKFVEVEGEVATGWGFLGGGFYRLEEGKESIWVQPFTSIPPKGRRPKVRGVVKAGVVVSSKPYFIWLAEGEREEVSRKRREKVFLLCSPPSPSSFSGSSCSEKEDRIR